MKNSSIQLDRTKVVVRHLPPTINEATLMEQIDVAFAGRYSWVSFRQGKNSQRQQSYSRAYIDFKRPEDVIEFAEFFNGHVFVNEKGTQFKTIVEYAPSQRVPKQWSKKDVREGTLYKDPDYLEFLELLAKPVENLPSAEIQLERREAERAGAAKEAPIVTPLMDFIRQKRAAKNVSRRSLPNGKMSRRAGGSPGGSPSSASSKRGSDKRRNSATMQYVLRDPTKSGSSKDRPTRILVAKRDDNPLAGASSEVSEDNSNTAGLSGITDAGKKILLLKGKEKEISNISNSISQRQNAAMTKNNVGSSLKQGQRHENSGKIIRSILLNKDARQSQTSGLAQSEQQIHSGNLDKDRRPPRASHAQIVTKDSNGTPRNKDRPDRGLWTLRRSDGSYASDESFSSSGSQPLQSQLDLSEGSQRDAKVELSYTRSGDVRNPAIGRSSHSLENGSYKHLARRGQTHIVKDNDSSSVVNEGKMSKRGGASGHINSEKQVWVQKSNSGT